MMKPSLASAFVLLAGAATAAVAPPPVMSPRDFATAAAQSDQFEIASAQTALGQSRNAQVRAFAEEMVQDHARTGSALRQAAIKSGMAAPPPMMSADQARLLYSLQSLRGPEFDRLYAQQQVLAHTEALTVQQHYAASGTDPNLRQAAAAVAPIIQHHLDMARQLRDTSGGR